ncbi:Histidine biosynthesis bifunctional protein HisIE [Buchnera aphidicola (Cinara kochiana kochiana)]|uniref:Histidine biosynthesis bifunctional protein HisIE n=1 Tax=Buchnera aphidicola (Cinara kochiana kochiana) TaxID=2518976 RepID=A0A451D5F3_9GAMM|nr:bifunctional phosphoribosyl-AMP cyclohydrolase/phosphoribosyl-ATP diphosphatase HisIE [Buchnera aphidicola]VFP80995.1 Histidine biosynthesis bifunctional protein HisIE [Buchnera aphidicola (Cinara kochiana kochiana)]
MLTDKNISNLNWNKLKNMVPAIAQHYVSGEILMFGYMTQEAFNSTIEKKLFTLYSRQKNRLWIKGETSKNFLYVKKVVTDCDCDVILVQVQPTGNTCHLNRFSCFENSQPIYSFLLHLESIIKSRKKEKLNKSYISNLFYQGSSRIAQKVGEEAVETVIAFLEKNPVNIINESSDLLFHLLVLLQSINISFESIINNLKNRMNK